MNAGRLEIASLMTKWVGLGGVGKNPARFVALDGAVLQTRRSLPWSEGRLICCPEAINKRW